MNRLHGKSADENWNPSLDGATGSQFIFKLLEMQDFSIYWNPSDEFLKWTTAEELAAAMEKLIPRTAKPGSSNEYSLTAHQCAFL